MEYMSLQQVPERGCVCALGIFPNWGHTYACDSKKVTWVLAHACYFYFS